MKGIFTGDTSTNTDLKEELLKELPDLKIELEQKIFGDNRKSYQNIIGLKILSSQMDILYQQLEK